MNRWPCGPKYLAKIIRAIGGGKAMRDLFKQNSSEFTLCYYYNVDRFNYLLYKAILD